MTDNARATSLPQEMGIGVLPNVPLPSVSKPELVKPSPATSSVAAGQSARMQKAVEARLRIRALQQDPSFIKRFMRGDADARAKWNDLHVMAWPPSEDIA